MSCNWNSSDIIVVVFCLGRDLAFNRMGVATKNGKRFFFLRSGCHCVLPSLVLRGILEVDLCRRMHGPLGTPLRLQDRSLFALCVSWGICLLSLFSLFDS